MRATRLARAIAFLAALASTAGAQAQPSARSKRSVASVAARPDGPAAVAYRSGKQPFVGAHAPSLKPVELDEHGRPMLALRTINRGESLAIAADSDDGGFGSADL